MESSDILNRRLEYKNTTEAFREDMSLKIITDRIGNIYGAFEASYLSDDLEIIAYNINDNFEVVDDYEKVIRKVKMSQGSEYFSSYPMLLHNNTSMILNLTRNVSGDVYQLLTCLPKIISDKLIQNKASRVTILSIIKVFDKEVKRMTNHAKESKQRYALVTYYLDELRNAKDTLQTHYAKNVKESYSFENIADMQPDIINYDSGVIEDIAGYMSDDFDVVEAELEDSLVEVLLCGESIDDGVFENFIKLCDKYTVLEAGTVRKAITRTATKAATGSRKIANKATDAEKTVGHVANAAKRSIDPLVNKMSGVINKLKSMDKEERTNRIITGQTRITLIGLLRKAVTSLATISVIAYFNPQTALVRHAIVVIGILTHIALNKAIDKRERKRIQGDLDLELKMVREKIEDARSAGNTKAKYDLMRIENKLEKDLNRIKYNLQ